VQSVFRIVGLVAAVACLGCSQPAADSSGSAAGTRAVAHAAGDAGADEARLAELIRAVDEVQKAANERTAAFRLELKQANRQYGDFLAQVKEKNLPTEELKKLHAQESEQLRAKVVRITAEYNAANAANMERTAAARQAVMKQKADMANAKRKREKGAAR
jgi:hypothetical protein